VKPLNIDELDPGIRRVVRWLREHGFETTDSGDGVSKWSLIQDGEALDFPHVFMVVRPEEMVAEARRLRGELASIGITCAPEGMGGPSIVVSFDPAAEVDDIAILALTGLPDAGLP
jgi:hypothetical protein